MQPTYTGEEVTDKDVMDMIKEADLNGDGAIDFVMFHALSHSPSLPLMFMHCHFG